MLRFAHAAMATQFVFRVDGADESCIRKLCGEAFREIDRLESELSRFEPGSDIAGICTMKPGEARVFTLDAFDCLHLAQLVAADTGGAFDATVGPVFTAWRADGRTGTVPDAEVMRSARERTGWEFLLMDESSHRVGVRREGMQVDLGAIGKGYALDRAAEVFREWGVTRALLSAGSTVLAMEPPAGRDGWVVDAAGAPYLLNGCALSASGTAVQGLHIFDPRTAEPVRGRTDAWAVAPEAALADALSTAFFVMAGDEIEAYCRMRSDVSGMVAGGDMRSFNWKLARPGTA